MYAYTREPRSSNATVVPTMTPDCRHFLHVSNGRESLACIYHDTINCNKVAEGSLNGRHKCFS